MESMDIDTSNEQSENKEDTIEIFQEEENNDFDDDINEENNISISQYNKKGKKLHTIQSKIKIIKYAKENSRSEAIKKYNVPSSTLSDWFKKEKEFQDLESSKLQNTTLHKGPKVKYQEIYNKFIDFIEFNRKLFNPVTTWSLLLKMYEIEPSRKNMNIKSNMNLIYKFLIKYGYSFRTKTHIGQSMKESSLKDASLFWNEVYNNRLKYGFNTYGVGNMDETPIFFNMYPNKTIAKKGNKTILIKTQSQEKCRISVILCITADGEKLPPFLIFKAKEEGYIEKNLSELNLVKNKKCYIACNLNAWSTEKIILRWYKNIWRKYLESSESLCEGFGYLIMDKAPSHITEESLAIMKNDKNLISFIPAGLTRFIQPLDVSINKPFKDALKKEYINYCINMDEENLKKTREKMIEFVCKVWYDEYIITKEMIKKSFICTGIIYDKNQKEGLFTAWQKMQNENPIIENDLANDYEEIKAIQEDIESDN